MVDLTQAPAPDASGSTFMVDPAQAPAPGASGSAGGAAGPAADEEARRARGRAAPSCMRGPGGGAGGKKKVRITEAHLESSGESGPAGGAARARSSGAGLFDVGRRGAARTAVSADTAVQCDRTTRSPARLTNRGGFRELGFLPGLLGIAHGIAHEVAHGIAETHGTTGSARARGSRLPRPAPGGLEVITRIAGSSS